MCNIVNTRFLRPFGVITEIPTKSPQKLYNGSSFSPYFTQKSFFSHWKVFDLKSSKQDSIYASTENVPEVNIDLIQEVLFKVLKYYLNVFVQVHFD